MHREWTMTEKFYEIVHHCSIHMLSKLENCWIDIAQIEIQKT